MRRDSKILGGQPRPKIAVRFLKFTGVGKKTFPSQDPKLTTATDEVEHWDPDRIFRRLLDR